MEKVTIVFADGTELEAEKNGTCFIADEEPKFPEDLSEVTITEDGKDTVIENAEIVECAAIDDRYWFTIVEIPESVREAKQVRSDIDYIAMEVGVEL